MMTTLSDPERGHARFLKAELDLGFTFTCIATQRYDTGYEESAGRSILNAEKAYETVVRFLSDPKSSKRLTDIEVHDLTAELERLREKLSELERFRTQRKVKGRSA
jgi:hypothetical protein